MSDFDVVQMDDLMARGQYPEDIEIAYNSIRHNTESDDICPDCGGEVFINKPSGNGFCIECDYRVSGKQHTMEVGQKVTYISHGKYEHGIVKSISDAEDVFVVYNCNGEWNRYFDYTAARTMTRDLVQGWIEARTAEK